MKLKNKTKTYAKILADSINYNNLARVTTFELYFPRSILAEYNTHGAVSRNAASSRAIPINKFIESVENDGYVPYSWGVNQSGMQSFNYVEDEAFFNELNQDWQEAKEQILSIARKFNSKKIHKQFINRLLEPFFYVKLVSTGTDWENFFALRCNKDTHPEFQILSDKMLKCYVEEFSNAKSLKTGEWHLPYHSNNIESFTTEEKIKISVARCARTSYLNFDGKFEPSKDYELYDSLLNSGHMSPFEHIAKCVDVPYDLYSGKLRGWECLRKTFPNENRQVNLVDLYLERKQNGFIDA